MKKLRQIKAKGIPAERPARVARRLPEEAKQKKAIPEHIKISKAVKFKRLVTELAKLKWVRYIFQMH
jgi:hypothetical protein